jgi:hypothetical protein
MTENYCRVDAPPAELTLLRSKSFCPKVWFGEQSFEKTVTLTRNGTYASARFTSKSPEQSIAFYQRLVATYPNISITYEFLATGVAGYGKLDKNGCPSPIEHTFSTEAGLIALRALREWKLAADSKFLIQSFVCEVPTFKYDDDGDCIMMIKV